MVRRSHLRGHLKSGELDADIPRMAAHDLPAFDPAIIERYVENTYRKATAVFLGSVVAGVMIGAIFGAMPLTSLGSSWPIPRLFGFATMMVGAVVGGVIGYLIGDTRAFLARLQGQTALAQIEAAKDARLALESIQQIQALAMRRAASSALSPRPSRRRRSPSPRPHRWPPRLLRWRPHRLRSRRHPRWSRRLRLRSSPARLRRRRRRWSSLARHLTSHRRSRRRSPPSDSRDTRAPHRRAPRRAPCPRRPPDARARRAGSAAPDPRSPRSSRPRPRQPHAAPRRAGRSPGGGAT